MEAGRVRKVEFYSVFPISPISPTPSLPYSLNPSAAATHSLLCSMPTTSTVSPA